MGLKDCRNYLHDRILLNKSNKLLTHFNLCKKLSTIWSCLAAWKAIPLGKRLV